MNRLFLTLLGSILLLACPFTWANSQEMSAQDLVYQARVAAAADQHRRAIDLYLAAIAAQPALGTDLSLELGHQYTWAELPDSAIAWYEYHLRKHPGNLDAKIGIARAISWDDRLQESVEYYESLLEESGDRRGEVLLGLANVKSWQQDLSTAEKIYREVLEKDPDNREAKLGLADVTNRLGKTRTAQAMYLEILGQDPGDTRAIKGLAIAQSSAGRPDVAVTTLRSAPPDEDLLSEAGRVRGRGALSGSNTFVYRDNTSDGDIRAVTVGANMYVTDLTRVGLAFTRARLTQPRTSDVTRDQLVFTIRQRFNQTLEANFNPGYQWNAFDPFTTPSTPSVDEFNLFIWDAYVTITPVDWVRIDVGNARQVFDIPTPIFRRIDVVKTNVGLDWRLHNRVITFWEPSYTSYGDGNERLAFEQRLEWVPPVRMPIDEENYIVLSQGAEYMGFSRQLDNGYFDPESYLYLFGGLRFVTDIGTRTSIRLDGRLGAEKEASQDWASIGSFEGALQVRLGESIYLRTGYSHSGSRLASPDGFRAKGFYVSVDYSILR